MILRSRTCLKKVREPINNKKLTKKYLTLFEDKVKNIYESSMINSPIHLSNHALKSLMQKN